ncbi:hypothetical protein ACWIDJ_01230 [Brevundimonas naejangsanensis]
MRHLLFDAIKVLICLVRSLKHLLLKRRHSSVENDGENFFFGHASPMKKGGSEEAAPT